MYKPHELLDRAQKKAARPGDRCTLTRWECATNNLVSTYRQSCLVSLEDALRSSGGTVVLCQEDAELIGSYLVPGDEVRPVLGEIVYCGQIEYRHRGEKPYGLWLFKQRQCAEPSYTYMLFRDFYVREAFDRPTQCEMFHGPLQWNHGATIALQGKGVGIIATIPPEENDDGNGDWFTTLREDGDLGNARWMSYAWNTVRGTNFGDHERLVSEFRACINEMRCAADNMAAGDAPDEDFGHYLDRYEQAIGPFERGA